MGTKAVEPEIEQNQETPTPRKHLTDHWASPRFRAAVIGGGVLVLIVAALLYYYHGRETTDDAEVDGHITPIASKIYGTVTQVLVDDNQHVKAGQVLVRIDPRDYQARVEQARAALLVAEGQARSADVGVPLTRGTTESDISASDAGLAAAQAEFERAQLAYQGAMTAGLAYAQAQVSKRQATNDRAQADLGRMKPLLVKAEISEQQYDAFLARSGEAASELKAAQEKLVEAQKQAQILKAAMVAAQARVQQALAVVAQARANAKQVHIRAADASSAAAAVTRARANLEAAELELGYAMITAPTEGVVTKKSVEPGQIVQPGQGLFVLVPLNDVWVTANFKETQLAHVRPGQKAEVHVDMYGETFPGHVDSIAGATGARLSLLPPENATGNFVKVVQRIPVKIALDPIPPAKAILRPGMNVEVTITTR